MTEAFTDNELHEILKFENEHLYCYRTPDAKQKVAAFTIKQSFGSGIGINTYITCDCCGETKDCTDYSCW